MGIFEVGGTSDCRADSNVESRDCYSNPKGKMKVLKKIKRRMGLVSRSSSHSGGTNNLPPLLFHNVHGDNIKILREGTVAKRVESFCKGIAFSSRSVKVNEKVCIKFLEISNNWSGVIRFGFTCNDPNALAGGGGCLPKYACPDLTNKPGYWAKALPERFCSQGTVLSYYVTDTGDVRYSINGEDKGVFITGVNPCLPLWALLDVYGNSTAVEFVDVRHQLNNARRSGQGQAILGCEQRQQQTPAAQDDMERIAYTMQQVHIQQRAVGDGDGEGMVLPVLRHQPPQLSFTPLPLHRTRGRNVRFNTERSVAHRKNAEFCQGYVFTARPLQIGERVVVQILATEPMFQGCLGLGLTSCDPATLQPADLPDDSNFLLDRPEYWVLSRDFARSLNKGDEVSFCVSVTGEVQISRNGSAPMVVIHVDQTLRLWAFFDIYGSTQRIRVLSSQNALSPLRHPDRRLISPSSESMNSLNSQSEMRRNSAALQSSQRLCCVTPADIQVQPGANGGVAVLSVILPPAHANLLNHQAAVGASPQLQVPPVAVQHHPSHHQGQGHHQGPLGPHPSQNGPHQTHLQQQQHQQPAPMPVSPGCVVAPVQTASSHPSGTMMSCSSTYIEPMDTAKYSTPLSWAEQNGATVGTGTECTICYENPIDAVLYMCGHMCMCYECALQQWRGKGGGHCPLCRAVIRDVIRTYKS